MHQHGRYIYLSLTSLKVHGTTATPTATCWNNSDSFQITGSGGGLAEFGGNDLGSSQIQGPIKQACECGWLLLLSAVASAEHFLHLATLAARFLFEAAFDKLRSH